MNLMQYIILITYMEETLLEINMININQFFHKLIFTIKNLRLLSINILNFINILFNC